ncbi:MAG TPA: hypothetical protein VHE61_20725 [Opitutaceae bacterium]|nr:hypothetical protein [Opitutaceae bacterium]
MHPKNLAAGIVSMLAVAAVDYTTGYEVVADSLYFGPVAIFAWTGGRAVGVIAATAATLLWTLFDVLSGHVYHFGPALYWNAGQEFVGCAAIALLVARIRAPIAVSGFSNATTDDEDRITEAAALARATLQKLEPDGSPRRL